MNIHNRNITGDYSHYCNNNNLDYYPKYYNSIVRQDNNQHNEPIYSKKLSAQGPNFLHNTKMNLSTVKLDVNNNAPALMNTLIERNKEIKALEKEIKILNESNIFLNNKVEMLKILASNFGASQDDIELTMSTNDVFCIPKPSTSINYPQSDSSLENLHINIEEESDCIYLNNKNTVNINKFRNNSQDQETDLDTNSMNKEAEESKGNKKEHSPKNLLKRSSTLLKTTKSLSNSMQTQNNHDLKYLTGTRFGPSVRQRTKLQANTNNKQLTSKNTRN